MRLVKGPHCLHLYLPVHAALLHLPLQTAAPAFRLPRLLLTRNAKPLSNLPYQLNLAKRAKPSKTLNSTPTETSKWWIAFSLSHRIHAAFKLVHHRDNHATSIANVSVDGPARRPPVPVIFSELLVDLLHITLVHPHLHTYSRLRLSSLPRTPYWNRSASAVEGRRRRAPGRRWLPTLGGRLSLRLLQQQLWRRHPGARSRLNRRSSRRRRSPRSSHPCPPSLRLTFLTYHCLSFQCGYHAHWSAILVANRCANGITRFVPSINHRITHRRLPRFSSVY